MSKSRIETVACPVCGHTQDVTVWETLNGDLDPDAKRQLMEGTLFRVECKNCGNRSYLNYAILYHDMTHRAMVYYVDESSVEQTKETMIASEKAMGIEMPGYRKRIVTDQNTLREKAIIFEHGLDDRVLELIKLVLQESTGKQFPNANIAAVYFLVENGKFILEFIGDEPLRADIPASAYDGIKNKFADRLTAAGDEECIIDRRWAAGFLQGK